MTRSATHTVAMILGLTSVFSLTGCIADAIMRVVQPVELLVTHSESGEPVPRATVDVAYAKHFRYVRSRQLTSSQWLDKFAYRRHETDITGRASMGIETYWIAGGLFADSDVKRDRLSGELYLIRIKTQVANEILIAEMGSGLSSVGDRFKVSILSVGSPRRLRLKEFYKGGWQGRTWTGEMGHLAPAKPGRSGSVRHRRAG